MEIKGSEINMEEDQTVGRVLRQNEEKLQPNIKFEDVQRVHNTCAWEPKCAQIAHFSKNE